MGIHPCSASSHVSPLHETVSWNIVDFQRIVFTRASQVVLVVNCLPTQETQETQVPSLGQEDCLGEEMAGHSSIRAWKIPWTEEPGGPQSMGSQRVGHN